MNNGPFPSVRQLLDAGAEKYAGAAFIKYSGPGGITEKSYSELRDDALCVCRFLRNIFPSPVNIAIAGKTAYEYLVFLTGIIISGNTAVPFSPEISPQEAVKLFTFADVEYLFYDASFADRAEFALSQMKLEGSLDISDAAVLSSIKDRFSAYGPYASLSDHEPAGDAAAVIIFTSGTTGVKKGVMLSENALVGNIMYTETVPAFDEGSCCLSVLPMSHCYSLSGDFIKNLKDGVTLCINGDIRRLNANLRLFEPRVMRVVPMIAQSLLKAVRAAQARHPELSPREAAETVFGRNIKWLISGGAYLQPELAAEYEKYGILLRQGYGMTEAGCRISVPDEKCDVKSVGRVTDICRVRIENGEIQVSTPTMMTGYYKMPAETREMFTSDGWLKTGDLGELTPDGQLFVTGRIKNLIILSNGENVSPEAIEKKFEGAACVSEVLVYAKGDTIAAEFYPDFDYCKAHGKDDPAAEITGLVRTLNATAKPSHVIAEVIIRDTPFERTPSGKIKRTEG